jgi:phenylpyruvate tautomerase PptA (4-oxalocrotonate tautomerase family)
LEAEDMPRVKIDIRKGRTNEEKRDLMDAVHGALVEALLIPEDDRIQTLYEHDDISFEIPPYKTEMFTLIEITMFPGRSLDAKRNLYKAITRNLRPLNIEELDIMVILQEPPLDNWGLRGKPASEIKIDFKIDV